jgi:hypothetical protein
MSDEKVVKLTIPKSIDFSDLKLVRNAETGGFSFDWTPIEAICLASWIDIEIYRTTHEDNVNSLIAAWYLAHLEHSGERDPVADELIAEIMTED